MSAHLGEGAAVALQQFLVLAQTSIVPIDGPPHVVVHLVDQLPVDVGVVAVVSVVVREADVVPTADTILKLTLLPPSPMSLLKVQHEQMKLTNCAAASVSKNASI